MDFDDIDFGDGDFEAAESESKTQIEENHCKPTDKAEDAVTPAQQQNNRYACKG